MNERVREMLPLAAWVAALVGAVVAFTAMGSGPLAAPALTDPGSWSAWAVGKDPVVATAAVLRLVVLLLAWYLLGATTVGAVARLARLTAMVRVADALSLPVVRRVLQASLGVGLATAVAVSSTTVPGARTGADPVMAAAAPQVEGPAPPRMRPLPPREAPPPAGDATVEDRAPTPAHRDLPAPEAPTPEASTPVDRDAPPPTDREVPAPGTPDAPTPSGDGVDAATVTVRPGDHLWSIAERHLAARDDRAPTDDEVAAHWRRLIEVNRDRLVDPANPDLILPGQQFVLPDATDDEGRHS